jgi:hypothetical protein
MDYKRFIFISAFLLTQVFSYSIDGGFFTQAQGAKSAALGGSGMFTEDGGNPQLLLTMDNPTIGFGIGNIYSGLVKGNYFSSTLHMNDIPLYIGVFTRKVSGIPDTRNAWQDDGNTIPEPGEINYFKITTIQQQEIGVKIASAQSWKQIYFSTMLKPHYQVLAENSRFGMGVDINASYEITRGVTIAGKLENALGMYTWNTGSIEKNLPRLKMGGVMQYSSIQAGGELGREIRQGSELLYTLGGEILLQTNVFIRVGKSNNSKVTAGVGIKFPYLQLDYAFVQPAEELPFKATQFFTLSFFTKELHRFKGKITP